jgi:DNA polymerase-3 subunit gamma/tau
MTTLYLKYRPQTIKELDITEARDSLSKIVKADKIPHAMLFSGPKGTGKTSAARIVAKIVNCESKTAKPCNKCEQCKSIGRGANIDVVEIDAASHRGIDDVRTLRDAVKLSPAEAKKKIYIIDEAHMLTTEASNALLKTLEEPPEHVMFILATTNPEKLIGTIRSRTTNINFRKATDGEVVRSLARVISGEKRKVSSEVLMSIAKAANGSFRDATKILEQLFSEGHSLKEKDIKEYLFQTKEANVEEFLDLLAAKDTKNSLLTIHNFMIKGGSIKNLMQEILGTIRLSLLGKVGVGEDKLPNFSKEELILLAKLFSSAHQETNDALIEELPTEIAIIKWCSEVGGVKEEPRPTISEEPDKEAKIEKVATKTVAQITKTAGNLKEVTDEVWKTILAKVKPINSSIEALLRAARPIGYDGKNLTLGVFYRFHKERLEDGNHRRILEEAVESIMGVPVKIICTLTEPPVKEPKEETSVKTVLTEGGDKDIIKIAEEIFGN